MRIYLSKIQQLIPGEKRKGGVNSNVLHPMGSPSWLAITRDIGMRVQKPEQAQLKLAGIIGSLFGSVGDQVKPVSVYGGCEHL